MRARTGTCTSTLAPVPTSIPAHACIHIYDHDRIPPPHLHARPCPQPCLHHLHAHPHPPAPSLSTCLSVHLERGERHKPARVSLGGVVRGHWTVMCRIRGQSSINLGHGQTGAMVPEEGVDAAWGRQHGKLGLGLTQRAGPGELN